jgi:hypothetical protein
MCPIMSVTFNSNPAPTKAMLLTDSTKLEIIANEETSFLLRLDVRFHSHQYGISQIPLPVEIVGCKDQ